MTTETNCTICTNAVSGTYCSNCGQQMNRKPITFISVIVDFVANVFSLERSVLAFIFKILINPKKIISNYWLGNRKFYPSPGKVFFYSLAVAAVHISFVNEQLLGLDFDLQEVKSQFFFWLLIFPMLLITSFLWYIRRERAFIKSLVSLLYLASSLFIVLTVIPDVIGLIATDVIGPFAFIIFFILIFISNARVMDNSGNKWKIFGNSIAQILVFIAIITLFLLFLYYLSPDAFHWKESTI